jgi:hypothetical protein
LHSTETRRKTMEKDKIAVEYKKPEVKDYGDLRELTATQLTGHHTDVPKGHPSNPPFSIFSR